MTRKLLILSLLATVTVVALVPVANCDERRLGWLSSKYEVGNRGPETISTGKLGSGKDDPGGKSYGSFQLASKRGVDRSSVETFVETDYENDFSKVDASDGKLKWLTPGTDDFDKKWREVVKRDGERFLNNEHEFIYDTHYKPVVNDVKQTTGLDIDARGEALRNAVWSTAVQHGSPYDVEKGHAHKLIQNAVKQWDKEKVSSRPGTSDKANVSDKELLNAIYDERERRNPRDVDRYKRERDDALMAQSREPKPEAPPDLNKTALGLFAKNVGIIAGPVRSPPKELFVERGQMTFDSSGYDRDFSTTRKPSVPGAYSGVRIGRGYDLGRVNKQQAESDLRAAGLSDTQIQTYADAAGLKGDDAKKYLDNCGYGQLYSDAQKAGLKGADISKYISDRAPQDITLVQQNSLFETSYSRAEKEAREAFPDYDKFPAPAREAVADMVFDRGLDELNAKRPGFVSAVAQQDWDVAAAASKRNGAGVARNQQIRKLLESAAAAKAKPQ